MKSTLRFLSLIVGLLAMGKAVSAQVSGNITLPSATYPSLASVITALNTQGVSGAVTVNLPAGFAETAPTGGYLLGSATLNGSLSATSTLTFQKSGTGSNPLITAYAGGTGTPSTAAMDGIWTLTGADYVTINGIDLVDTNTANPATMEYGFGLFKASATDGAQNNTIKNCVVTLSRNNNASGTGPMTNGSCGILQLNAIPAAATTALTITAATGASSGNKYYSNTLKNANNGVALIGFAAASPFTLADQNNEVGGAAAATGNTIVNFGGASGASNAAAGVLLTNQWAFTVAYNTINNNNGTGANHPTTIRGIYTTASTSAGGTINNNTMTIAGGGTTSQVSVIENTAGSTAAGNTISISGNTIQNCTNNTNTTGLWYGIWNSASAANLNLTNNTFAGNDTKATSGAVYLVYNSGAVPGTNNMTGNTLSQSWSGTTAYSGVTYSVYNSNGTTATTLNMSNNIFGNYNYPTTPNGTGATYFVYNTNSSANLTISGNNWNNMTMNTSAAIYLIYNSSSTQTALTVTNNVITTGFTRQAAAGAFYCYYSGSSSLGSSTQVFSGNNFSNVTAATAGTGAFYGIYNSDGSSAPYPKKTVFNNTISNISYATTGSCYGLYVNYLGDGGTATGSSIYNNTVSGITTSGTQYIFYPGGTTSPTLAVNVYGNTISGIQNNTAGTASTYLLYIGGGTLANIYNNKVYNAQSGITTGGALYGAYVSSGTTVNLYNNTISNLRTPAGSSTCPVYGIYLNSGTNMNVYHNTVYLNPLSNGANFGAAGLYYSSGITGLDLRNNILYVNALPAGTGFTSAVRRSAGTGGTAPSNLLNTSNSNIYYVPNVANAYLYSEGTALPLANTYSISTDASFNTYCSGYKAFMSPRESSSFTENNLVQIGTTATYQPSGTSFAKGVAVATTAPAVTTDFSGATRATPADAGALQFTGTALDAAPPTIVYTPYSSPSYCANGPSLTAEITDNSGVNTTSNPPRMYYRKTTEADAFSAANNSSSFNGWKYVTGTGSGSTFVFTPNYGLLTSQLAVGESLVYFVIAQDNNSTPNVGVSSVSFAGGYCPANVSILPAAGPTTAVATLNQFTRVAEIAPPVVAPGAANVCPGSYTTLTATPTATPYSNVTLGTGTLTNATYEYPTPYGQYYGGAHDQYIIRASELNALGITAGNITSISFNQSAGYTGNPLKDYVIRLAPTAQTAHPGSLITTGFTTVYSNVLYTPPTAAAGWVQHAFSTPFVWDGVSSIVVDITFLNCTTCNGTSSCTTAYSNNGTVNQTATSFVSAFSLYADNNCTISSFAPSGGSAYTYSRRPNMQFNGVSMQAINWAPVTGLYKNAALTQPVTATDTNKTVYASPAVTTTYTASNMYAGCNGTASNSAAVTVLPAPAAVITPSAAQAICPGTTATLTASANGSGFSYQWKKNGVAISGATALTYAADTIASYTVTVTNNGTGCTATSPATAVSFNPVPAAAITAGGPTTFCDGALVSLNANVGSGLAYQWRNNGTAVTGATASGFSATTSGSYTAAVTNSSGCTTISNAIPVTVNVTPTTITPSSTTTFCVGGSVVLNAPSGSNLTYQWKKDGVNIPNATTSSYTAGSPVITANTYSVTVTNTSTGCTATTNPGVLVTIGTPPAAPIAPAAASQGVCIGSSLVLTTNTANGLTYQWKKDGVDITTGGNAVSYGATAAGNYTVVVSSGPGCFSTSSPVNVYVNPLPVATATAGTATTVCQGDSVLLQANSGSYTYQWRLNGVPQSGTGISRWASQAGAWTVAITNNNGCVGVSNGLNVALNPLPAATVTAASATTFCAGVNVVLNANSGSNLAYQWVSNGNAITGFTAQAYTASASANYQVRVTNTATGCFATSPVTAVTANPRPVITTTPAGPNAGLCAGSTLTIAVPNATGTTYQWSRDSLTLSGATAASYSTTVGGAYRVRAVITATGCDATSAPVNVIVNPMPVATTTPAGQQSICDGDTLQLAANTGAGLTYQWKLNNANITGAALSTYGATAAGSHVVEVTNQYGCKTTSAPVAITIKPKPQSYLTYQSALVFCAGSAVVLNAANTEPGLTYQWYLNGQPFTNPASYFSAANTGVYSVRTTNSVGCSRLSAPVDVVSNPKPTPVITMGAGSVLSTVANNYANYQWYRNNTAIAGATSASYNVLMNGCYRVFVRDTNGCENTSAQFLLNSLAVNSTTLGQAVRVFPNPTSGILKIEAPVPVKVTVRDMRGSTVLAPAEVQQIDLSALADGLYMVLISNLDGQVLKMERVSKGTR